MPGPVNTAGAEDSPFISLDGNRFFFFFTPDVDIPAEQQILDGVTGIWWTWRVGGEWVEPARIILSEDLALDGAHYYSNDSLWFGSVRQGNYAEIDYYISVLNGDSWGMPVNAGSRINQELDVGEIHIAGNSMYYGLKNPPVTGDYDLYVSEYIGEDWSDAESLGDSVNSQYDDYLPYVSGDGNELWFTRPSGLGYTGPAIFRSVRINDSTWSEAEEIISNFAGEPCLDSAGNIYFVHHFFNVEVEMLEADIYVAYRYQ